MAGSTIFLHCKPALDPVIRARMTYAFRVFAAVYGYHVVDRPDSAEFFFLYGEHEGESPDQKTLHIPARYASRRRSVELPALKKICYANEDVYLVHGLDADGNPDWLGEIFEWLSSSLELPIEARDAVGRIPFDETVFQRQNLSPLKPQAGLLMAWMENTLRHGRSGEALPKAKSPVPDIDHMVICSHDIDFYFTNRGGALHRFLKNLAISITHYSSPSFFAANCRMILGLLTQKRPGEYMIPLLDAMEERGLRSTLFAVANGGHRRDPEYVLSQIAPQLREAVSRGFSVGVHASYSSVVEKNSLARETAVLKKMLGTKPAGNRQHWLRFDAHAKLIKAIEDADFCYDSSLGFSETCGFRNGANFAFPPYDFEKEKPCGFLEIPLVIMDGSLATSSRKLRRNPQELADSILAESRKLGWGGISILWHNPMEPIQVPDEVNKVFWKCALERKQFAEQWMSADEFLAASLPRFQAAGLLKENKFDAFHAHRALAAD